MVPSWCTLLAFIAQLIAGQRVGPYMLQLTCAQIEWEITNHHAEIRMAEDDTTEWRVIPLLMDGQGFASALVRVTPHYAECLTDPREYPSPGDLGSFAGWSVFYVPGNPSEHPAWVCLDLMPVQIANDARRRVLIRELYQCLPPELQCP